MGTSPLDNLFRESLLSELRTQESADGRSALGSPSCRSGTLDSVSVLRRRQNLVEMRSHGGVDLASRTPPNSPVRRSAWRAQALQYAWGRRAEAHLVTPIRAPDGPGLEIQGHSVALPRSSEVGSRSPWTSQNEPPDAGVGPLLT